MMRTLNILRRAGWPGNLPARVLCGLLAVALTSGCAPAFNWRDVQLGEGVLKALLPCRADEATRPQTLAGHTVPVQMMGCQAQGHLFVVAITTSALPQPQDLQAAQEQWQQTVLHALAAQPPHRAQTAPRIKGEPWTRVLKTCGRTAEHDPWCVHAVWFELRGQLVHAALYGPQQKAEIADTFFAGLEPR
jgi:hypothetical protein